MRNSTHCRPRPASVRPLLWSAAVAIVALTTFLPAVVVRAAGSEDRADIEVRLRILAAAGDNAALAELLEEWLADHPADVEAHLQLGSAYADGGHAVGAEKAWRRMLELHPGKPDLYLKASQSARHADLLDVAVRLLIDGRAALRSPDTLFSWQLSDLYLEMGDWPAAVRALVDYVRQLPNRYTLAETRLLALARNEADATSEEGLPQSSRSAGILAALQAERATAAAEGDDPLPVTMLMSSFALEMGQPRIGLEALTSVAHLPDAAAIVFNFASRCEAAGRDDVAAEAYALYSRHTGNTPYRFRSLLRQAAIEERTGRFDAAVETYRTLTTRFPSKPEALEALSRIGRLQLRAQGDAAAARISLEALLEAGVDGTTQTETLALLAECDLRQDDLDRATQRFEELIAAGSGAQSRLGLAEIAFFGGDFDAAVVHLDCLLTADPGHALANDALELLLVIEDHQWQPEALRVHARARLRERQNRHREAAADWRWLAQHTSGELLEDSVLAQAQLREGDGALDQAMTLYQQVADFPEGRYGLEAGLGQARILETRGRRKAALKVYETSLLRYPENARAPQVRLEIQRLRDAIAGQRG